MENAMLKHTPIMLGAAALLALAACGTDAPAPVSRTDVGKQTEASPGGPHALEARQEAQRPAQLEEKDVRRQLLAVDSATRSNAPASPVVAAGGPLELMSIRARGEPLDRENYAHFDDNPLKRVVEHPVSTFSIDVDTGAYSNTRRMLNAGRLPAQDAVRVEELINYFAYDYPAPGERSEPFNVITELGPNPWNSKTHLLHIGLKGFEVPKSSIPAANLVFLIDVSGSMNSPDKLPLLKSALTLLTNELRARDRISIVVYAGGTGVVLEPVPGDQKGKIVAALESLSAGGRTNGAAGIRLAYQMAEEAFVQGGINRVLLATDGDFNVGTTNFEAEGSSGAEAQDGNLAHHSGIRYRQLQRPLDGAARRRRQRQLRLHRHAERSAQSPGRPDVGHAADHRQGREDPDRVQSGRRLRIPAHRL
jgi:Ca-activated chloride channel family protein